jgi:hypothetical protein
MAPIPDINALADKQYGQNKQMAKDTLTANRADQTNPFGSLTWEQDDAGGWTQNQSYNDQEQGLYDQRGQNQAALGQKASGLIDNLDLNYGGASAMPTVGGYSQQAIDTMRALQAPQLKKQREQKEAQMAAMGIGTGSGNAWNAEQQNLGTNENQADMQAIMAGINQGNTMFGQGMQARQQGVTEEQSRANAIAGMMGQSAPQDLNFSSYNQAVPVGAPDYVNNALTMQTLQQQQNNAKAQSSGGLMGTIGGIAGGFLGSMAGPMGSAAGSAVGKSLFD